MNASQVHLMLNHIPVLGTIFVVVALAAGLAWRRGTLLRFALVTCVAIALVAVPVYFSGGRSEEQIEHLAGVQRSSIERHEDLARVVTIGLGALGLASLLALLRFRRREVPPAFAAALLVAAVVLSGALAWTAHLGGQIRHSELAGSPTAQATEAEEHRLPERE